MVSESYLFGDIHLIDELYLLSDMIFVDLELNSLGINYIEEKKGPFRYFKLLENDNEKINNIIKRSTYVKKVQNKYTDYYYLTRINVKKIISLYGVHYFYPYKGKFNPHMIRSLINFLNLKENSTILDPFNGSGTTGVEATYLGYNYIGYDISPLCVLMSNVKINSFNSLNEIKRIKNDILYKFGGIDFTSYRNFNDMLNNLTTDKGTIDFYNLARFSTISDNKNRKKRLEKAFVNNIENMIFILENLDREIKRLNIKLGNSTVKLGDARNLELKDESVDAIITSPPYSITLDYIKNDLHSLSMMDIDIASISDNMIGVRGEKISDKLKYYFSDMYKSYSEMVRVTKKGSYIIIVIGNFNNVDNVKYTIDIMEKLNTELIYNIVKKIQRDFIMKKENILIFRKK